MKTALPNESNGTLFVKIGQIVGEIAEKRNRKYNSPFSIQIWTVSIVCGCESRAHANASRSRHSATCRWVSANGSQPIRSLENVTSFVLLWQPGHVTIDQADCPIPVTSLPLLWRPWWRHQLSTNQIARKWGGNINLWGSLYYCS